VPAAPRDWSDPFLEQAKEDLSAAYALQATSPSTFCVLLQMVFEKIGKAAFAGSGQVVPHDHEVATRFFAMLLRFPNGKRLLTSNGNAEAFIRQLELAQPSVAKRNSLPEQLEYPWEDAAGIIRTPCCDLGLARRISNPRDRIAADCLRFASSLIKEIPVIIPLFSKSFWQFSYTV